MTDFLSSLNEQQREAVLVNEGPLLILAGAGSGKTRVIAHRIAYLIAEKGVAPWNILAVTFTNKAAQEMRQRVQRLLRDQELSSWPLVSTFHSLCVRILRQDIEKLNDKYTRTFTIYDSDDSLRLIKNCIKDLGYDEKQLGLRATQGAISSAKNRGEDVDAFAARADYVDERRAAMARVYQAYEERLHANNALDFDDLLIKTVRLLRNVLEVREKYNNKFRYILVDEYQDTNSLQFALISLLTEKQQNIAVVGDEDQSIYKWRGADITNILNFEKHFPNTKTIRLEQNYRSTQTILNVAGAVVKHNIERKGKTLWTSNPQGDRVRYFQAFDAESEARFVAAKILEHRQDEYDLRAAVLYRTNSQSRVFEESMRRAGLPYNIVGGFSFYERMEVRDIIAYLKLALNPNDSIALQRVINSPARGIGKQTLDELARRAQSQVSSPKSQVLGPSGSPTVREGSQAEVQSPESQVPNPDTSESTDRYRTGSSSDRVVASDSDRGSSPTVREGAGRSPTVREGSSIRTPTSRGSDRVSSDVQSPTSNVQSPGTSENTDKYRTGSSSDRVSSDVQSPTSNVQSPIPDTRHPTPDLPLSLWETIALVIDDPQNLSARAVSALRSFRKIILRLSEMAGTNVETAQALAGTAGVSPAVPVRTGSSNDRVAAAADAVPASPRPPVSVSSSSPVSDIVKAAILDTGYENALKSEKTDEAEARLENLQELVNAAVDYDEQGIEGLREFIDHSALVSDADQYKEDAVVTLMTAHSAKGLEFPLVFIVGLEDGLFPHSRSATDPAELEEERRLAYVAMTRAERFLYVTHAMKRRVYGEELASEPSQFLNEMPLDLMEDLSRGNSWLSFARGSSEIDYEHGVGGGPTVREGAGGSPTVREGSSIRTPTSLGSDRVERGSSPTVREGVDSYRKEKNKYAGKTYDSVDSIAEFFKQRSQQLGNTSGSFESTRERAERTKSDRRSAQSRSAQSPKPKVQSPNASPLPLPPSPTSSAPPSPVDSPDFSPGSYVKHAKYGRGLVLRREGVGDSLKLTVTFPGYGQKKLVQKYAALEKA